LIANGAVAGTLLAVVISGATSADVLATAIGRGDLGLPGILAGSLGNAPGTYAGILVAVWLS
jgi:uncharacterized membrane protein